ncbi:MAG: DUF4349 domain-containing protein [Candidatus Limnocylindrales bacterium]
MFAALIILIVAACAGGAATLENVGAPVSNGPAFLPGGPTDVSAAPSAASADAGSVGRSAAGGSAALPSSGPLIVKTGTLQLQVDDVDAALVKARTAVAGVGGFVSGSQESTSSSQPTASITYRIPAQDWDAALIDLRKLARKVLGEKTQAVEVTGQVLDLQARIANLKVTEAALQAIMVRATKISDVLDVQNQLTTVQGQIEELSTQQAHLQDQTAYGTLTVGFEMPAAVVQQAQAGWDLGTQVDQAVAQLVELGQSAATVSIWLLIVGLPFLVVLIIGLAIVALLLRRFRPRPRSGLPLAGSDLPPSA